MKLWLISQDKNTGYDTYDSAIVAAETKDDAKSIHPSGEELEGTYFRIGWAPLKHITVEYIGEAALKVKRGVICASFNAG